MSTLAEMLHAYMSKAGCDQTTLAAATGIDQQRISAWLKGSRPSAKYHETLRALFNLSEDRLLEYLPSQSRSRRAATGGQRISTQPIPHEPIDGDPYALIASLRQQIQKLETENATLWRVIEAGKRPN